MNDRVLVVCGPTAAGKTALGVELALHLNGEVVSADSMQVYRRMDIGTAKPTEQERRGVTHHMLDVAEPTEDFSAARYASEAAVCVDDILARGRLPVVVGGTGLYIDALIAGRVFPAFSGRWRAELQARATREGTAALLRELASIDPERAALLHPADQKRIIRALEVWYETGETMTAHDRADAARPPRYRALRLGIAPEKRADLWARIDRRVDDMRAQGLEREVRALLSEGVAPTATAMQAIGYRQLLTAHDPDAAFAEIKLRTRQYAKRQMTWFSRTEGVRWLATPAAPNFAEAVQNATEHCREFGIQCQ